MMSSTADTAADGGIGPSAETQSFSVPPESNSIVIAGAPPTSSLPKM